MTHAEKLKLFEGLKTNERAFAFLSDVEQDIIRNNLLRGECLTLAMSGKFVESHQVCATSNRVYRPEDSATLERPTMACIREALDKLINIERKDIIDCYCHECGSKDDQCQCETE